MAAPDAGNKGYHHMWVPAGDDYRAMQMAGGLAMALVIGIMTFPPLRRHGRLLGVVATVGYIGVGLVILLYRLLQAD